MYVFLIFFILFIIHVYFLCLISKNKGEKGRDSGREGDENNLGAAVRGETWDQNMIFANIIEKNSIKNTTQRSEQKKLHIWCYFRNHNQNFL